MNKVYYTDITKINTKGPLTLNQWVIDKNKNQKDEHKKIQSYVGYKLLDIVLKKHNITNYGLTLNDSGKPGLVGVDLYFSISHSENIVCLILSDSEVGVDCEYVDSKRDLSKLIKYAFTINEIEEYNSLSNDLKAEFFYKAWVQKEAYFKKLSIGLSKEFSKIECQLIVKQLTDSIGNKYFVSSTCGEFNFEYISF